MTGKTLMDPIPSDVMEAAKAIWDSTEHICSFEDGILVIATALLAERNASAATIRSLQERAERQWQPIETAPKDGTTIVLFCPQGDGTPGSTFRLTSGSWFIAPSYGTISDPEVDEQEPPAWVSWDGGFSEETMMPTLWQPLPSPPLLSLQSGEGQNDG